MAEEVFFRDTNFKAGDSPVEINLLAALGVISQKSCSVVNVGPGPFLISTSVDDGATFGPPIFFPPLFQATGAFLNNVDRLKIIHFGVDTHYTVIASATQQNPLFGDFPDPEIHFANNYFAEFLKDGSTINMAVDGSVTPVEYSFTVATDTRIRLSNGLLTLEDGNQQFSPENFGAIPGALPNGIETSITPFGGVKTVLETWKINRDIQSTMFRFKNQFKQDGAYVGMWEFASDLSGGKGLYLNEGDKFSMLVQDDLSALDFKCFNLKGRILQL